MIASCKINTGHCPVFFVGEIMKNSDSEKKHGNKGNCNAKKAMRANTHMQIRLTDSEKSIFVDQAKKNGMTLSKWVLKVLMENVLTKQNN